MHFLYLWTTSYYTSEKQNNTKQRIDTKEYKENKKKRQNQKTKKWTIWCVIFIIASTIVIISSTISSVMWAYVWFLIITSSAAPLNPLNTRYLPSFRPYDQKGNANYDHFNNACVNIESLLIWCIFINKLMYYCFLMT